MMKRVFMLFFFWAGPWAFAFGQDELKAYQEAEKEINAVYQQVLQTYRGDREFVANLRTSQRLWIQFRDAEVKARYPKRTPGYYGSALSFCVAYLKTQLTHERTKTLRQWLSGVEEGDVCAGSVRLRE